jgi:hypothetical protein|tara:strand:- start:4568 stop:5260 length:693 start_codon:yes stop_codon:yes gene_type:complete
MKEIKINIKESCGCPSEQPKSMPNVHNSEESRMHRTTLAHLLADTKVLLSLIEDEDDLPEWLETKITKAGDYMNSASRYMAGNIARDKGQLEEFISESAEQIISEYALIDDHFNLYEDLLDAIDENGETPCPQCLYEAIAEASCGCPDLMSEAEYQGRKVTLNKPMRGDVKKSKVYVKNAKGNVVKVNFGDKKMKIKKSNPKRRKSFRARHNCKNPGPKWKARYWSCKAW